MKYVVSILQWGKRSPEGRPLITRVSTHDTPEEAMAGRQAVLGLASIAGRDPFKKGETIAIMLFTDEEVERAEAAANKRDGIEEPAE